jgi:hypothetical protein
MICLKKYFETNIKSLSEVEKKDFAKNALKELLVWDLWKAGNGNKLNDNPHINASKCDLKIISHIKVIHITVMR